MITIAKYRAVLLGGALIAAMAAAPAHAENLLQVTQQGNVSYVTGGIGDDSIDALKAQSGNFNLEIINSEQGGAYLADTGVTIKGKNGEEVLNVKDAGPLLYVKLPPGSYRVMAVNENRPLEKHVKVGGGLSKSVFVWPIMGDQIITPQPHDDPK